MLDSTVAVDSSATRSPSGVARLQDSRIQWLLLLAVLFISCFYGLNAAGVFDRDEGLYSTAARQMLESGDWVVPRIGPDVRFAKPPLIYWLQAPFIALLGPTPVAVRLPSAFATVLTALIIWAWARRRATLQLGWLAALVFLLCPMTMIMARHGITDSLLTFCFTLTAWGWIEGYKGERWGYLVMAAGAALAVMTKGATGVVFPAAALVGWLLLRKDGHEVRRMPWLLMFALFLLIAVPWHWAMWVRTGPTFIQEYFFHNHVQRFLGQKWGHVQPFWFYIPVLLGALFPWSVMLPLSWWHGLKARHADRTTIDCDLAMWSLWVLIIVVFFSASRSKLPEYILPALPGLSILIAVRINSRFEKQEPLLKWERIVAGSGALLVGVVGLAIAAIAWHWRSEAVPAFTGHVIKASTVETVNLFVPSVLTLGIVFLCCSPFLFKRWSVVRTVGVATILNSALIALFVGLAVPAWDQRNIAPLHDLGRQTIPALERGEPVVIYAMEPRRASLRYVMGHTPQVIETSDAQQLQRIVQRSPHGCIITMRETELPVLPHPARRQDIRNKWALWRY